MKVYEYLAAGLPVVASPLPALEGVQDVVVADGLDATLAALDAALAGDGEQTRRARSARAAEHSWDARLAEIGRALA
jgi:hypothetical protein